MTSYSTVRSESYSYSISDIEDVVRRFTADIVMMAQSSGAISEAKARNYAHDVERLAKKGYLSLVDLTLFDGGVEVRAAQYRVNTSAGGLAMSRPGGVMWPRVARPDFRIILSYTPAYNATARLDMQRWLKIGWVNTNADTSHAALSQNGGRDYASNGWGMQRKDFGQ